MISYKILITEPLAKQGMDIFKRYKGIRVDVMTGLSEKELMSKIRGYDAMIVRSGTTVTKKIIDASDRLRIIGRAGVGLDNVDIGAASKKGIVVLNAPTSNTVSTAEHAFALMLTLTRNILPANKSLLAGKWERKKFLGIELYGKVLGIIGLGKIGSEVARRASSFGMKVIAYDPYLTETNPHNLDVEITSFEEILKRSNFISLHVPFTEETEHIIDDYAFSKMKKGVRIINTARGGILDENVLMRNIRSGKVAGAAIDVFETTKRPPIDSPVIGHDNIVVTPHIGSSTEEAQLNVAVDIAEAVSESLLGRGYRNAVNVPVVEKGLEDIIAPYAELAERLGVFMGHVTGGPIKNINIRYAGEIAQYDSSSITRSFVKNLLSPILGEHINYVNSMLIAKERGVKVIEERTSEAAGYANLVTVELRAGKKKYVVEGTLLENREPRIVRIDGFHLEAIPRGNVLFVKNNDVPGVVGKIGTILGSNGVNIAAINMGRNKKKAISVFNIDARASDKIIAGLKGIDDITDVVQVGF